MAMRAQFWSFDVIFAIIIFSFAITILTYTWYTLNNQLSIGYGNGSGIMQTQLQQLSGMLFSQGQPSNWQGTVNTTNTITWIDIAIGIGTAGNRYSISPAKVYTFQSMSNYNYQAVKQELGIGYEYFITIKQMAPGGSINMTIGRNPATHGALTSYVDREYGTMSGIPVAVQITLWTNTTLAES